MIHYYAVKKFNRGFMKIGIMGGTFDPIHQRHVQIAEIARDQLDFEEIWVMPTGGPDHKKNVVASPRQRFEMMSLAIEGKNAIKPSCFEVDHPELTFSAATFDALQVIHPDDQFELIMGEDSLKTLPQWQKMEHLIEMIGFVVVKRIGLTVPELADFERRMGRNLDKLQYRWLETPAMDISSTSIRELLKQGLTPEYLDPKVLNYIKENNLYR